jgi:hypothetical protein
MFRNRCRNLGVVLGPRRVAIFVALIPAMSFLSTESLATGEQREFDPPVAATVHKAAGETIEVLIQSIDAEGFTVSSKGQTSVIAWRELTAKDVFALHEKILTNPKGLDWFNLGRLLWQFPDGKKQALTAFALAQEMEPLLKEAIKDAQKGTPANPTTQASTSENALDYLAWLPESARAVTCMTMDAQGNTWIGTEDDGVYLRRAATCSGRQLSHYTSDDGIGDNDIFAIKCDRTGRVWIGHARHGVSVFRNGRWKNYDVPDGPISDRVWAIVECPVDGDIWIAGNAGLTRYSITKDTWRHYTPGLVPYADRICSMAFDGKGRLFAATDCQGLVKGEPEGGEYRSWTHIRGPEKTPQASRGKGLPSGLLNDVLVAADQSVWAATDGGLAWSQDAGATWQFLRGEEWIQKVRGLRSAPATSVEEGTKAGLLPEDYLTCLAEDRQGNIWMGFYGQGLGFLDPVTFKVTRLDKKSQGWKSGVVSCILPQQDGSLLIGDYCGGAARLRRPTAAPATVLPLATSKPAANPQPGRFPATASPPTLPELNALCKELWTVPVPDEENGAIVVPMPDDWRTQGKWLGRYGRYWACICAIDSPNDYLWGAGAAQVQYRAGMGSNHEPGDSQRYWVNRLYTDESRVLEMPPVYMDSRLQKKLTTPNFNRREACWDDHGEAYPRYQEGPDLVGSLDIPSGKFILSFYFQNEGVHFAGSAVRDYILSLRVLAEGQTSIEEAADQPALAETRVHDFYHGVYKRFFVQGPIRIGYKVDRNYSVNAILSGIMLDLPEECPPPYFLTDSKWEEARRNRDAKLVQIAADRRERPQALEYKTEKEAALAAMKQLRDLQDLNPKWWAGHSRKFYVSLFCWLKACKPDPEILAGRAQCCHALCLFDPWENYQGKLGLTTARWIEQQLKWDGHTATSSGAGNRTVAGFVEETLKK